MSSIRIRTRKDGSAYTAVLYRHEGRQCSQSFDDHAAALRWQALLDRHGAEYALRIQEIYVTAADHSMTVNEWGSKYLKQLTGIGKKARKDYNRFLAKDIEPRMGVLPLDAVDNSIVADWINALEDSGLAAKTIANRHGFLSAMFKAAVVNGKMRANPCDSTRLPRGIADEMTFLTKNEFASLYELLPVRYQPLARLLVASGMRMGEALALTIGDIDQRACTIRINKAWKQDGDGGRELGPPKSRKSYRTINVPAEVIAALDLSGPLDQWLFRSPVTSGALRYDTFRSHWAATVERCTELGGKRPRAHDLRHTCASWMIAASVPLPVIQAHLGHESITTTIDRYGHLDRSAGADAAAAISSMLPPLSGDTK